MGDNSYTSEIARNGKTLTLVVVSLSGERPTAHIERTVTKAFNKVARHLKEDRCVLYVRDNREECLEDDAALWSVRITNLREAFVAMPRWGDDQTQVEHLALAVNEACFSLVRAQRQGLCGLFGDEVLRRGLAALYAEHVTGYEYPLSVATKHMRRRMLGIWFKFYSGPNKSWSARRGDFYRATQVGYELAKTLCAGDDPETFCLEEAQKIYSLFWTADILWTLNHPQRRRSARILQGKAHRPTTLREKVSMLQPAVR